MPTSCVDCGKAMPGKLVAIPYADIERLVEEKSHAIDAELRLRRWVEAQGLDPAESARPPPLPVSPGPLPPIPEPEGGWTKAADVASLPPLPPLPPKPLFGR